MHTFDKKFFLDLEMASSEEERDGSLQIVFPNEMNIMSKGNSDYVKKLRKQIEKIDDLQKKQH